MKSFFIRLIKFLFESEPNCCPVCGKRLAMQAPIIHFCHENKDD